MTTLPKDKHALVIQGTEKEKEQACIEIRDWAVKNGIPIYWNYKDQPYIKHHPIPIWEFNKTKQAWMLLRCNKTAYIDDFTIHHTVESFMKVFEGDKTLDELRAKGIESLLRLAMNLGCKYEVRHVDFADAWTVPVLITQERYDRMINDNSIKYIRLILEPNPIELTNHKKLKL